MKLSSIKIEKFRSIKKAKMDIDKLCAIVGENNVGKSAVLRGLNCFFNINDEIKYFENRNHLYALRNNSKIELEFILEEKNEKYKEYSTNNKVVFGLKYEYSKNRLKYYCRKGKENNDLPNEFLNKIKEDIDFVLIPTERSHEAIKWKDNSIIRDAITKHLRTKKDSISSHVKKISYRLKKNTFDKVSKEINQIYGVEHNFIFSIKHKDEVNYNILLNDIVLEITDGKRNFSIEDCGSGIQSLTVIAFYRYLAKVQQVKYILGVEEPEMNLHPQTQREFINSIIKSNDEKLEMQVILTTHSTIIVDNLEHSNIILFKKEKDEKRGFRTICSQISSDFWVRNKIEEFRYYQFYNYRNSDFFYSKFVIITESKTDAEVIKFMLKKLNIDIDAKGISIINLEGVKNLKYPFYLINELDMKYLIILDKDYFIPYLNDKLDDSRDINGYPKYRYEYKKNSLIDKFITEPSEKDLLMEAFKKNHSTAMNILEKHNIICFRFMLEIDLIVSKVAREKFYDLCSLSGDKRNQRNLLTNHKKQIKNLSNILAVLKGLPKTNYPNTYKRLSKYFINKFL